MKRTVVVILDQFVHYLQIQKVTINILQLLHTIGTKMFQERIFI